MTNRKKLLFVVHRYAPYPGGSEYYVQNMAEEALSRGHDVTVLSHEHKGDLNGVKVTSSYNELNRKWDLIIVHGADCVSQNVVHYNYPNIISPVLYMIIKPTVSPAGISGLYGATYLGFSTKEDLDHIYKHDLGEKAIFVPHGIPINKSIRAKTTTTPNVHFVSAGGFWPHKGMVELVETFKSCDFKTPAWLHLYGYGDGPAIPYDPRVTITHGATQDEVLQAIANADAYILNSTEEGFGLVLLEAMINKTPWFSRDIAGASVMRRYGYTYSKQEKLKVLMETLSACKNIMGEDRWNPDVDTAYDYVCTTHSIKNTIDAIETIWMHEEILK